MDASLGSLGRRGRSAPIRFAIDGGGNGRLNTTRASVDARLKFIGELLNIISTVGYAGLLLCVRTKIH
jgi:hypothetical protein